MGLRELLLSVCCASVLTPANAQTQQVAGPMVGVVEQSGAESGIRTLFVRRGDVWAPLAEPCRSEVCLKGVAERYPRKTVWSLLHYGKALPSVTAERPDRYRSYVQQGVQQVAASTRAMSGGTLASTLPRLADPDGWRSGRVMPDELRRVRGAFRREFADAKNCSTQDAEPGQAIRWMYADRALRVRAVLGARTGARLMAIFLTGYRCDGVMPPWALPQWFVLEPGGTVRRLPADGMWFAGAADFAASGHSELLFAAEDEGWTYWLFDAHLRQLASVQFSEH